MKIYVIRHGETNYNFLGLHNADPKVDVHLTEKGIGQAQEIANQLSNVDFDAIFISELPRTAQTAAPLAKTKNLTPIVDPRLNDIDSGYEGQSVATYHEARNSSYDPFLFKVPNHESSAEVYDRTASFLKDLSTKNYQNVLIITSAHNLRHFRCILDRLDPREEMKKKHVPNTETFIRELTPDSIQ